MIIVISSKRVRWPAQLFFCFSMSIYHKLYPCEVSSNSHFQNNYWWITLTIEVNTSLKLTLIYITMFFFSTNNWNVQAMIYVLLHYNIYIFFTLMQHIVHPMKWIDKFVWWIKFAQAILQVIVRFILIFTVHVRQWFIRASHILKTNGVREWCYALPDIL